MSPAGIISFFLIHRQPLKGGGAKNARCGVTLMELIIALAISVFIFELIFYVYMLAFRSWDIGLMQGRVEDEARRAVQIVSREVRSARIDSVIAEENRVTFLSGGGRKVIYLYSPEQSYAGYLLREYVPTRTVQLRSLASSNVTAENYGSGIVIAKELLPPPMTRFEGSGTGVSFSVVAQVRSMSLTLNTQAYPRSYQ